MTFLKMKNSEELIVWSDNKEEDNTMHCYSFDLLHIFDCEWDNVKRINCNDIEFKTDDLFEFMEKFR